ncbi:hypothetical protein [Natrarchaeobius oligotrophus]|uniref:Uncharacterized protein n=1 Tax=Natrarchaeobius chitinivorans TaxID=1679083 RepID=A0A3N6MHD0_NATCH|nr:hypothetical protein [Natrarchaeobius chitinivorans]RQH03449.1 hypothetical protein EA472_02520 [Natrarchaeobius chitinivorans]
MTDQPPSPSPCWPAPTPTASAGIESDERVLATTAQLVAAVERSLDCRLDEDDLEELLLELDRRSYVEWVTVTRTGEYVWDLTDAPDRIADAVAVALVSRLCAWLEGER